MPWWGLLLTWLSIAVIIGYFGTRLVKLFPRRTLQNWSGSGVNTELTPPEVGLLLGRHQGVLFSTVFYGLESAGKARVVSLDPVRIEWVKGDPDGPIETAFAAALGPGGEVRQEGALALIEAIYDQTNEKIASYSGRRTALYYEHLVDRFWEEAIERDLWAPGAFGWLLLRDPRKVWEEIGETPDQRRLKDAYRAQGRFETELFPVSLLKSMQHKPRHAYWVFPDLSTRVYDCEQGEAEVHARLSGGFNDFGSDGDPEPDSEIPT